MIFSPSPTLQSLTAQASLLRANLEFQPNGGTGLERDGWFRSVDEALQVAHTPAGPVAKFLGADGWNLRRAQRMLNRVRSRVETAGLLIVEAGVGLSSNAARFSSAKLYVLGRGSVRKESEYDTAVRLTQAFFESRTSETLALMLDLAFAAHIRRLDLASSRIFHLADTREVPPDAAYPRYFRDAHTALLDRLHEAFMALNGGAPVPWKACVREIEGLLIEHQIALEGIAPGSTGREESRRGLSLAMQIPDYSAFQLLCLLVQIGEGRPDPSLVGQLKRASNGRILALEVARRTEVYWRELLKASELMGGIDLIHANIRTAFDLACDEQPKVDPQIVSLQVRAAVARLGKETGSSRAEYDWAIERLRALENDPEAGKVIRLKRGFGKK
jgi:hypothetical protein